MSINKINTTQKVSRVIQTLERQKRKMYILTDKQQKRYDAFYESTHNNVDIDTCWPFRCIGNELFSMHQLHLKKAKKVHVTKGEISEVLANVMAVAAGQKRLQVQEVIESNDINFESYEYKRIKPFARSGRIKFIGII